MQPQTSFKSGHGNTAFDQPRSTVLQYRVRTHGATERRHTLVQWLVAVRSISFYLGELQISQILKWVEYIGKVFISFIWLTVIS